MMTGDNDASRSNAEDGKEGKDQEGEGEGSAEVNPEDGEVASSILSKVGKARQCMTCQRSVCLGNYTVLFLIKNTCHCVELYQHFIDFKIALI